MTYVAYVAYVTYVTYVADGTGRYSLDFLNAILFKPEKTELGRPLWPPNSVFSYLCVKNFATRCHKTRGCDVI